MGPITGLNALESNPALSSEQFSSYTDYAVLTERDFTRFTNSVTTKGIKSQSVNGFIVYEHDWNEKMGVFVLGKLCKPHSFKSVQKLSFDYAGIDKALMTFSMLQQYICGHKLRKEERIDCVCSLVNCLLCMCFYVK